MLMGRFSCNPPQCHLDLCLNECQSFLQECSHCDSWHSDPAVTAKQAPPLGFSLGLNRSQIQLSRMHSPHYGFYLKGLTRRAHMELSEPEVRLAKKPAQRDRVGEGAAMLGPGQPPFLKLVVHELCVCVHLLEQPSPTDGL